MEELTLRSPAYAVIAVAQPTTSPSAATHGPDNSASGSRSSEATSLQNRSTWPRGKPPADARLPEPEVRQFVEQRKATGTGGISWVDDDERGDLIGQCHSTEHIHVEIGVVGTEVSRQQHEDACVLRTPTEQAKRCVRASGHPITVQRELERHPHGAGDRFNTIRACCRADERQGLSVLLIEKGGLQQGLARQ